MHPISLHTPYSICIHPTPFVHTLLHHFNTLMTNIKLMNINTLHTTYNNTFFLDKLLNSFNSGSLPSSLVFDTPLAVKAESLHVQCTVLIGIVYTIEHSFSVGYKFHRFAILLKITKVTCTVYFIKNRIFIAWSANVHNNQSLDHDARRGQGKVVLLKYFKKVTVAQCWYSSRNMSNNNIIFMNKRYSIWIMKVPKLLLTRASRQRPDSKRPGICDIPSPQNLQKPFICHDFACVAPSYVCVTGHGIDIRVCN